MQCEKCNVEMVKGVLGAHGSLWGTIKFPALGKINTLLGGKFVDAYRCPNCGEIKLKAE